MRTITRGLTPVQVADFHRDGFLFPLPAFSSADAAGWVDEISMLAAADAAVLGVPWNQKTHLLSPALDALVRDRRVTDLVAALLGEDLLVLSADVFVKPGRSSRHITWHQDVNYWDLQPLDTLTAWVALTPANRANGCMRYAPGAHLARIPHEERPDPDNSLSRGQELAVAVDEATALDVSLVAGEVALHHALTPHASGPNTSTEPRIGFAIRYASTAVRQLSGPPISARLARGVDRHGHFQLESGPDAVLSPGARAQHRAALEAHADTNFSTI